MSMLPLTLRDIWGIIWAKLKLGTTDYLAHRFGERITVSTKSGDVRGYKVKSNFDFSYINFIGIPYAKPPVGELRFKDPQPFEPQPPGTIINEEFSLSGTCECQPDILFHKPMGIENCLHLSIYSRDVNPDDLKPVMVWFHGGAFISGSNAKDAYNPEYLLRHDVIIITLNYRLGIFGFASLKDPWLEVPGNAGLKDQTMALKWINENCAYFGGDPKNITVFGESSGSASISLHLISDFSKGLFHKTILMSGTAYSPWVIQPSNDLTERVAKRLGWDGEGGDEACLKVLQSASSGELTIAQIETMTLEDIKRSTFLPFTPVVEPYESNQCFLRKSPKELFDSAWSKDLPIIVGNCTEESLLLYRILQKIFEEYPDLKLGQVMSFILPYYELGVEVDKKQCYEFAEQIKNFYESYMTLKDDRTSLYLLMLHDRYFAHATHRLVLSRLKNNSAPTFLLRFNFDSEGSMVKRIVAGYNIKGVCHADDYPYYLRNVMHDIPPKDSDEWKTIERMTGCFTSLAKSGDPNNDTIAPIQWKPVQLETTENDNVKYNCLNINNNVTFIEHPELERVQFWDQIYKHFIDHVNVHSILPNGEMNWTYIIAKQLGWDGEGGDKACLKVYQKASSDEIIRAQSEVAAQDVHKQSDFFMLTVYTLTEEPYESDQCFFRKKPQDLINSAWSKDIPVIFSNTSDEWNVSYNTAKKLMLANRPQVSELKYLSPFKELGIDINDPYCDEMGKKMKKLYFGYTKINIDTIFTYLMAITDRNNNHTTHRMVLSRLKNRCAPTYMLRFSFEPKTRSFAKQVVGVGPEVPGACHGDDLFFLFRVAICDDPPKDSDEWKTIERLCACVTSFMKNCDPNNKIIAPVQWEPVELEMTNEGKPKYKCLDMNSQLSFDYSPELDRMYFWDQMYEDYNKSII